MRLYAYHNGDKHEVDLALFPVELNEESDVVFTEDQYARDNKHYRYGYRKGMTLTETSNLRVKLPLVGGDALVATFNDWFVQP